METVTEFIFLGYNITTDGDYSHEIKRYLLLGRGAMKKKENSYDKTRQYVKKQRHYFANKDLSSQSYGFFPVAMYGWKRKLIT